MMRGKPLSWAVFFAICILLATAAGCGKKAWPKPDDKGEAVLVTQESASWANACLAVNAVLAGKPVNLERLVLELAPADCPGCPFSAARQMEFRPGNPALILDPATGRLLLTACGLDPALGARWRLTAYNVFGSLPPATSPDHLAAPAGNRQ